jgi:superfamily II DNA or RNA helicase
MAARLKQIKTPVKKTTAHIKIKPLPFRITPEYAATVCVASYLGKKGYTIPKTVLSPEDIEEIHKELFMRPVINGKPDPDVAFPVYRENDAKMYLPRFYGIARYGLPPSSEVEPGEDIDVPFVKELRDYQNDIVDIYVKHADRPIHALDPNYSGEAVFGGGAILEVPCGRGKCLGKDTLVLMYNGELRAVQDVRCGEYLMGDDCTPRRVLSLARGRETMYRVRDINWGESYVVNESHILSLKHVSSGDIIDISVRDYLLRNDRSLFGYRVNIDYHIMDNDADPPFTALETGDSVATLIIRGIMNTIPSEYMRASPDYRRQFIWGYASSVGVVTEYPVIAGIRFRLDIPVSPLRTQMMFMARSVGYGARVIDADTIEIDTKAFTHIYPIEVEQLDIDDYYGFEIDGNRRFVLGDCTVTHNTVMALKIISVLSKKTLILVHKEFLMNQWIERIAEFVPSAKVGKIQGPVFDVEGKDIVIGMIQTLYDKDFSREFSEAQFGLTIIDEVHRIGSEQFSRTLLKIITPYMLGISATVERKDGLTKVLNYFIGDKIYSEERENDDPVCVRAIEYITKDADHMEVEYDFRGQVKHSTMLSKLSNYAPRSDFVVRILFDLLAEHPHNQIMILAHQRALLTYLFEAIQHRNIAVGYYVGGMKEMALKETEGKRIVLATYAMAAEALDIKSLSTLVMVTPKTDIIQSVGRILRTKHENPIVVDVLDKHDVFQKQWYQRRRFYKKCGYRIRQIDGDKYAGMCLDWKTDTTWRRVHEPDGFDNMNKSDEDSSGDECVKGVKRCLIDVGEFGE